MGQYYKIVNLDKQQFLNPHDFGNGAKLLEFGSSGSGVMLGLAVLLSDGNGRGGGDLNDDKRRLKPKLKKLIGSWAGDRVVVTGDYADANRFIPTGEMNLYGHAAEYFKNISLDVVEVLCADEYTARDILTGGFGGDERRAAMIKRGLTIAKEIDAGVRLGHTMESDVG